MSWGNVSAPAGFPPEGTLAEFVHRWRAGEDETWNSYVIVFEIYPLLPKERTLWRQLIKGSLRL